MRKSFTLMEIVVAAVIVVVLATLGMGGYIFLLEKAKMQACAVNQETLYRVAEIKARETGTLGKFDLEKDKEYISRAYAEKVKEAGWFTKFSYFLVKINTPKQAYAVPAETLMDENIMRKYGVDPQILYCPSTGNKYGINTALDEDLSWDAIPAGTILIGDCANNTFTNLSELHPSHYVNPITDEGKAVMITVEGITMVATKEPHGDAKDTELFMHGKSIHVGNTIYKDGGGGRAQLSDTGVLCIKCKKHTNPQARKKCIEEDCPLSVEEDNGNGMGDGMDDGSGTTPSSLSSTGGSGGVTSILNDTDFRIKFKKLNTEILRSRITSIFGKNSSWHQYFNGEIIDSDNFLTALNDEIQTLSKKIIVPLSGDDTNLRNLQHLRDSIISESE